MFKSDDDFQDLILMYSRSDLKVLRESQSVISRRNDRVHRTALNLKRILNFYYVLIRTRSLVRTGSISPVRGLPTEDKAKQRQGMFGARDLVLFIPVLP